MAARLPGLAGRGRDRRRRACSSCSPSATAAAPRTSSARRRSSTTSPTPACGSSTTPSSPTRADVVVVAGHDDFDYEELEIATQAVLRGAELIGATRDAHLPDARRPVAGHRRGAGGDRDRQPAARPTRSSASPSRRCTRRRATASARAAILAVGDRLDVDVAGARRAGLDSALVLTGGTTRARGRRRRPAADLRRRLARGAGARLTPY